MPLSDEQRAMLQLLLEGGQGYDDIGSLLGITTQEVKARARSALTEMGGGDPDAEVPLSDYLLGQADPIGRADAVRHLQSDPEANAMAARLIAQLRLLAPRAELPELPAPRGAPRPPAPPEAPTAPAGPAGAPPVAHAPGRGMAGRISRALGRLRGASKRQSQIVMGLGAGAVLIIVGVLAIAGVFGGGDEEGDGDETAAAGGDELTVVRLAPLQGGSEASGQAVFAMAGDQAVLQINLSGLQPATPGQNYIVWLYNSKRVAFPLARDTVGEDGNLTGAAPIPSQLIPLVGQFGCVDVSLASNRQTRQALQQAAQQASLPPHSGQSVLRGQIPGAPGEQAPTGGASVCDQPSGAPLPGGAEGEGTGTTPGTGGAGAAPEAGGAGTSPGAGGAAGEGALGQ